MREAGWRFPLQYCEVWFQIRECEVARAGWEDAVTLQQTGGHDLHVLQAGEVAEGELGEVAAAELPALCRHPALGAARRVVSAVRQAGKYFWGTRHLH